MTPSLELALRKALNSFGSLCDMATRGLAVMVEEAEEEVEKKERIRRQGPCND